jgi:hypothetical protein
MVEFQSSPEKITVTFAEKSLDLARKGLPPDWEALLQDPEVAECVNELVLEKGAPRDQASRPMLSWDAIQQRLEDLEGSTG